MISNKPCAPGDTGDAISTADATAAQTAVLTTSCLDLLMPATTFSLHPRAPSDPGLATHIGSKGFGSVRLASTIVPTSILRPVVVVSQFEI
jgi:hypothetical protein